MAALLSLDKLRAGYGPIDALHDVSIQVNEGEIVALIGANGAGKTTTLMSISGLVKTRSGTVSFNGQDITRLPAHEIVKLGLAQSPEGRKIFPRLSVLENLQMGAFTRSDPTAWPRTSNGRSPCSRSCGSARVRRAGCSRAVSNRCWPSPGR